MDDEYIIWIDNGSEGWGQFSTSTLKELPGKYLYALQHSYGSPILVTKKVELEIVMKGEQTSAKA